MKSSDKLLKSSTVALCALIFVWAGVFAGDSPKPREERGTITEVNMNQHQLAVVDHKDKSIHHFQWNDKTRFTEHGKSVASASLKDGETARLAYAPGGDTPLAQQVRLTPAKAQKHTSAHQHMAPKS